MKLLYIYIYIYRQRHRKQTIEYTTEIVSWKTECTTEILYKFLLQTISRKPIMNLVCRKNVSTLNCTE